MLTANMGQETQPVVGLFQKSFVVHHAPELFNRCLQWTAQQFNTKFLAVSEANDRGLDGTLNTLMAYNLLNRVVLENKVLDVNSILAGVDRFLLPFSALNRSEEESERGVRVALLSVNTEKRTLKFGGAALGCLLMEPNDRTLHLDGTNLPIGVDTYRPGDEDRFFSPRAGNCPPGTRVLLYSHSLVNLRQNGNGEPLGLEGLRSWWHEEAITPLPTVEYKLKKWIEGWVGGHQAPEWMAIGLEL
jgi:hypothetical protein